MKQLAVLLILVGFSSIHTVAQDLSTEYYIKQGDSLIAKNDGKKAISMYKKAIDIDAEHAMAYHKIGQAFVGEYRKEGTENFFDSVIVYENKARLADPTFFDAYDWEVAAYRAKWRHGMIRKVLMDAIQHLPDHPEIQMMLGRNYFDTGNPGLALPYLEKSIAVGGENAPGVA